MYEKAVLMQILDIDDVKILNDPDCTGIVVKSSERGKKYK